MVIDLSVRRLYCESPACPKTTFTKQVPGLTRRYHRRTPVLQRVVGAVAVAQAGARLLAILHHVLTWGGGVPRFPGGCRGNREDGASRVSQAVTADRAVKQPGERPLFAGTDHQQVAGLVSDLHQGGPGPLSTDHQRRDSKIV
jgi:hypothetical protein